MIRPYVAPMPSAIGKSSLQQRDHDDHAQYADAQGHEEAQPGLAGGLGEGGGPELTLKSAGEVVRSAGKGLGMGFLHLGKETVEGKLAPTLTGGAAEMVSAELPEDRERMTPGF